MDRFTAMQVFVAVVDGGSQSAAADRLGLSRPVVSRHLADLEGWVGARLLHRTTRKLSLTAAGAEALPRCRQVLALGGEIRAAGASREDAPRGLLRITASNSLGYARLSRAVALYQRQHPAVSVELLLVDRKVDLVQERIDLALRISREIDPNLIARKLAVCESVVCAAPAYLREHGTPVQPQDLAGHNCLTHAYYGSSVWEFLREGEPLQVAVRGNFSANDALSVCASAVAGAGVAMLPAYLAQARLDDGALVALLPAHRPVDTYFHAVYASRRHMPATLRSMLDFLAIHFAQGMVATPAA
ncbi:LysR-family transcriptional regulator clustered with PA0057 [plant metagenome]|uniref:LysR-family transcriptional regulator clustered with PA0057 n=1 Tax=plant metagenome TaxID=1297885 RepID=A0A484TZN6_9ZZZZ